MINKYIKTKKLSKTDIICAQKGSLKNIKKTIIILKNKSCRQMGDSETYRKKHRRKINNWITMLTKPIEFCTWIELNKKEHKIETKRKKWKHI